MLLKLQRATSPIRILNHDLSFLCLQIARDLGVVEGKEGKGSGKGRSRMGEGSGGGAAPPPLTRDAAIAAARKRRREFTLPRKLPCGVTVITLGGLHPGSTGELARELPALRCRWAHEPAWLLQLRASLCRTVHPPAPCFTLLLPLPPVPACSLLQLGPALARWVHCGVGG